MANASTKVQTSGLQQDDPSIIHCGVNPSSSVKQYTKSLKAKTNVNDGLHVTEKRRPATATQPKSVPQPKRRGGSEQTHYLVDQLQNSNSRNKNIFNSPKLANSLLPNYHHGKLPASSSNKKKGNSFVATERSKKSYVQSKANSKKQEKKPALDSVSIGNNGASSDNSIKSKATFTVNHNSSLPSESRSVSSPKLHSSSIPKNQTGDKNIAYKTSKPQVETTKGKKSSEVKSSEFASSGKSTPSHKVNSVVASNPIPSAGGRKARSRASNSRNDHKSARSNGNKTVELPKSNKSTDEVSAENKERNEHHSVNSKVETKSQDSIPPAGNHKLVADYSKSSISTTDSSASNTSFDILNKQDSRKGYRKRKKLNKGQTCEASSPDVEVSSAVDATFQTSSETTNKKGFEVDNKVTTNTPNAKETKLANQASSPAVTTSSKSSTSKTPTTDTVQLEKLGLEQAEERLKKDHIVMLEKKSFQFPNARFFCTLCKYHLDNVPLAHRHIKEKRHRKLLKERKQDDFIWNIKEPPPHAIDTLSTVLIEKVLEDSILDENDLTQRQEVVQKLSNIINKDLPNAKVSLYGSSLSGFGFKTSDVNVDLQHPPDMKAPTALLRVLDIIENSEEYSRVKAEFRAKVPRIDFIDVETSLLIRLSSGNDFAIFTTQLLHFYAILDSRVIQLSMVFRSWARLCKLDLQHDGTLPPHSLVIMAIFFMQRYTYLPVLHEIVFERDMNNMLTSFMNSSSFVWKENDLWYHPTHQPDTPDDKEEEEEEEIVDENDSNASIVFREDALECDETSTFSRTTQNEASLNAVNLSAECAFGNINLGLLWLQLLKFYALEYPIEEQIITIRSSAFMKREEKHWSKKRLGVLDPFSMKRNLCRSMSNQSVFAYMMGRLKAAVVYFFRQPKQAMKKTKNNLKPTPSDSKTFKFANDLSKAVIANVLDTWKRKKNAECDAASFVSPKSVSDFAEKLVTDMINAIVTCAHKLPRVRNSSAPDNVQSIAEKMSNDITIQALDEISTAMDGKTCNSTNNATTTVKVESGTDLEVNESYTFEFSAKVITEGKYPVKVCGICKKEGHSRSDCPDEIQTKELCPLESMTPKLRETLNMLCQLTYERFAPSENEMKARDDICSALTWFLRRSYNNNTVMNLFGSSRNGFGFRGSDLDICMTFRDNETGKDLDAVKIIEDVTKHLRRNAALYNILPITTAKVPIVKFKHRESQLEGDISLYNLLAQRNTNMLSCYASIDRRCLMLGYIMKAFVKGCNIGDASRGSLSSYAYILMVIFYLQQKKIPVLPVLQELYDGNTSPVVVVDGWNSWFFSDIRNLSKRWSGYGKNTESVGELWLGLLRYYTEEFDFRSRVICIRQKKVLTTFEKEWTSKFISIEDPFDLNHNLGAGVSHKMTNFIIRVFINARKHFGIPPTSNIGQPMAYYFDSYTLTDGEEAPNDRCCKICGKIGHFIRDCPKNKRGRRRQDDGGNAGISDDFRCFFCNGLGHIKRDCPQIKNYDPKNHSSPKKLSKENTPRSSKANSDSQPSTSAGRSRTGGTRKGNNNGNTSTPNKNTVDTENHNQPKSSANAASPKPNVKRALIPSQGPPSCELQSLMDTISINDQTQTLLAVDTVKPTSEVGNSASAQSPTSRGFTFNTKEDRNTANSHLTLSSSAPTQTHPWSPSAQIPRRSLSSSIPTPHWPNQQMFAPPFPSSPRSMMTLAQIEAQMFHESPHSRSPRNYHAASQLHRQDLQYVDQCNRFGGVVAPASVPVGALPVFALRPTTTQPQFPVLPGAVGMQHTGTNFIRSPRSSSDTDITSPVRHQTGNTPGYPWTTGSARENSQ